MLRVLLAVCAVVLALLTVRARAPSPQPSLRVEALPLNAKDPAQSTVGALRFRGGLCLRSSDRRFGGLSDLRVTPDGGRLIAVSDCGYVFQATLDYDARGFLSTVRDGLLTPLRGPGGRALAPGEEDAESMARTSDGGLIVGFEVKHRLWRYPPGESPLEGMPVLLPPPPGLSLSETNLGIEAIATLQDGRLLATHEGASGQPRETTAWLGKNEAWSTLSYPLFYDPAQPNEPFRPSGAAVLPSGDVLVLERRYPPIAARIRRLDRASLEAGRELSGSEIARLEPPCSVDNFEGIDARLSESGETLIYLLSDDNHCGPGADRASKQRTLLLLFALAS